MKTSTAFTIRKTVAAIEVLGGVAGAVAVVMFMPKVAREAHIAIWQVLLWSTPPFVVSLVAGILLWREHVAGQAASLVVLGLQVPVISNATFGYYFTCGFALHLLFGPAGWSWYVFAGSDLHFTWAEGASGNTIGINVVALLLGGLLFAAIPTTDAVARVSGGAERFVPPSA